MWLASFTSNVGTLMHGVGAAWLMTSLSPSPFMVALVQTATTLPTFLLALPAGALADVLDRRRLLLLTQTWMLVSAAALGVAALFGLHSTWLLLLMTFSLGVGGALNAPASQLSSAIALNSAGFNLARAVGPDWVRGRTISVYLLIVFGCLAVGSAVRGAVATWLSIGHALAVPAAAMVLALALTARWRLTLTESVDLAVSRHWPTPELAVEPLPDQGPVFVIVEYRIDPATKAEFLAAMNEVRHSRLRAGAVRWNVLGDLANHGRYLESFVVESWLHHLRQHERVTVTDQAIEDRARAFHLGPEPPRVSHLLAEDMPG